jgi:uncharacterized Zn finger protein
MGIAQRALRGDLVSCWIVTDLNELVRFTHCKSDAGQGELCSHVGALRFAIEFWITADNKIMDFSKIKTSKFNNKSLKELQMHGKTMSFGFSDKVLKQFS